MKQILCLATEPWSSSPGRTQQLMSRLKDTHILYFYPAADRHDRRYLGKGKKVRPNVTVYALPPILLPVGERYRLLFHASHKKLGRYIADKAAAHRFRSPLLWVTNPRHVHLLDYLDYDGMVYDCDREWDSLPPDWEGSLAQAADVVFAASPLLCRRLSPCSPNIALLPNGVNFPLFANDISISRRDPLPQVQGPVLGWAGTIQEDLDLSPVLFAAQTHPQWNFLLVGEQMDNPALHLLKRLPNVILPGPCSMSEVPDWLYRCDVLLELTQDDRADDGVISPRVYEYLCTGKPVVAMLWPDQVETFPDVIYGAHDEHEFVTLCAHALEEPDGFVSKRRRDHAAAAAWPIRVGEVSRILDTAGLL